MIDKVSNFFQNYLLNPFAGELKGLDKAIYPIASAILFILSAGMVHLGFALYFWASRNVDDHTKFPSQSEGKIQDVFNKIKTLDGKYGEFGLTSDEYSQIKSYYERETVNLELNENPIYLSKDETSLPRSLVYVPDGPRKGMHILCKDRGIDEIGIGAFNRATLILHVDSGKKMICRSGLRRDVKDREIEANEEFSKIDPSGKYFATGTFVEYKGIWSQRKGRKKGEEKLLETKKYDADKVMIIMDFLPEGELRDHVRLPPAERPKAQTQKKNIHICLEIARGLVESHAEGLVNFDNKTNNIVMAGKDSDGVKCGPKMVDFGFVNKSGEKRGFPGGTRGYLSPEVLRSRRDRSEFEVCPANEMWILGCIMARVTKGPEFSRYVNQGYRDIKRCYSLIEKGKEEHEKALKAMFPQFETEKTLDAVLYGCLRYDPEDRLTAEQVAVALTALHETTPTKAHASQDGWLTSGFAYA